MVFRNVTEESGVCPAMQSVPGLLMLMRTVKDSEAAPWVPSLPQGATS